MTDVTQFEFALLKGEKGRGGTPVGVKAPYELTRIVEGEAAVEEVIDMPPEEEIPSTEIPEEAPIEESQPEPEEITIEPDEGTPALKVEGDVVIEDPEVETAVKPEVKEEEEVVEPVVEEPVAEEVVEEPTPAPPDYSNVVITFDPESPQQTSNRVDLTGTVTGLPDPEHFLMVNRKVDGNGTEFVGEVELAVDGERTVVSKPNALNPVSACSLNHLYQPQVYPFQHP